MLYTKNNELEDIIIELLVGTRASMKCLHERLKKERGIHVSLRAVYKTVTTLKESGVIVKAGKEVFINREWLQQLQKKLTQNRPLFEIAEGERIVYFFNSSAQMDSFWKTFVDSLSVRDPRYPVYFYNPHAIWILIPERVKSELAYYASFASEQKYGFYVIGGTTPLDKEMRRTVESAYLQIDLSCVPSFTRKDHITVFAHYVITVSIPLRLGEQIDQLYMCGDVKNTKQEIQALITKPFRAKVTIEYNTLKAKRLRKKLSKNFLIPAQITSQYDLF
jgi:hypothetical protein